MKKGTPTALLIATMDTKAREAQHIENTLRSCGVSVLILDGGIRGNSPVPVAINREEVAHAAGKSLKHIQSIGHEGKAMGLMLSGAVRCALDLHRKAMIDGVISLGGSMGTTLGTGVMRALPIGFPKVMISTMASRDTKPFVGTKDILMLHSVCDLSGLNRITRMILRNGALALAGMLNADVPPPSHPLPLVVVTTLGTTEACALKVRKNLEGDNFEVVMFHTVGSGGEAMEETVKQGEVTAVVDLSLHELADHLYGGDYDAGPDRCKAALQMGIPTVLVPGNLDFLVTGPLDRAQQQFPARPYHMHNSAITAVRTEKKEMTALAETLAARCNDAKGPVAVLIPLNGLSAFDHSKGPLHDPQGPALFASAFQSALQKDIPMTALHHHINDPEFAQAVIQSLKHLME